MAGLLIALMVPLANAQTIPGEPPDAQEQAVIQSPDDGVLVAQQKAIPENATGAASPSKDVPNPFHDPRDRIFYPGDTERIRPLGGKLIGNILLDQKEIWTSPFRMHKKDSKWWIGFGAVTAALVATDRGSSRSLENSPSQIRWGGRFSQPGAAYTLVPLVAGFYGFGALAHNAQARETGVLGAEALIDSLIVVTVLKPIGGRVRPDSPDVKDRANFFDGGDSFPSGHAIETWALASVIAHEYKHKGGRFVPYLAYGLAGVVSTARFAAQRHYASDIVAGSAMGWFIGRYVYQTHEDHAGHQHAWQPQIIPGMDPSTRSYLVSLRLTKQ